VISFPHRVRSSVTLLSIMLSKLALVEIEQIAN